MKSSSKLILALAAIGLLAAAFLVFNGLKEQKTGTEEIAAVVNGERITVQEVDREFAMLAPEQQAELGRMYVLNFLIEKKLLLQEADKEVITASIYAVNELYDSYLSETGLTEEEHGKILLESGSSTDEFRAALAEQVKINTLLNKKLPDASILSQNEVQAAYEKKYGGTNVSFDEAESEIVNALVNAKDRNERIKYTNWLKKNASIVIFLEP